MRTHYHPVVSVVVPCFNSSRYVAQTLRSILQQSFENWECIIVDDGSTDGSPEVVAAQISGDSRFRLILQGRYGVSVARNRGFYESCRDSTYVSFMDSDDVWHGDALSLLLEAANSDTVCAGVHGLGELINSEGHPMEGSCFADFGRDRLGYNDGVIRRLGLDQATCFASLCWTGPVYPPGLILARRAAYEFAGLFDDKMRHCEDWDMAVRLSRFGELKFLNRVILKYRRHKHNASGDHKASRDAVRKLHHKTFFSPENQPEHTVIVRQGWKAWQRFKMRERWRIAMDRLSSGAPLAAARELLGCTIHILRYLLGSPRGGIL